MKKSVKKKSVKKKPAAKKSQIEKKPLAKIKKPTHGYLLELNGAEVYRDTILNPGGSYDATGSGIDFMRLLALQQGLDLQTKGIKLHRNLPAASTMARDMLGIKGRTPALLEQVTAIIDRIQRERSSVAITQGNAKRPRKTISKK